MFLVITNDGDQPIALTSMRAELVTSGRAQAGVAEQRRHVPSRGTHQRQQHQLPRALARFRCPAATRTRRRRSNIRRSWQRTSQPKPLSRTPRSQDFLFFDVFNVKQPVQGSHIYLTGIRDANGNETDVFRYSGDSVERRRDAVDRSVAQSDGSLADDLTSDGFDRNVPSPCATARWTRRRTSPMRCSRST